MKRYNQVFIHLVSFFILILIMCNDAPIDLGNTSSSNPSDKKDVEFTKESIKISNHILPGYFVKSIAFDSKGVAWIGTSRQGLIKYDGDAAFYNPSNSNLPSCVIWDVEVDNNDNIWIGSDIGLIKYDRNNFTIFDTSNSPLAENIVWSIAIDNSNTLWLASCRFRQGGLMKYDGVEWTLYTPENSQLPYRSVTDVIVDNRNNIWVAISEGVNNGSIIKISGDTWTVFDKNKIGFPPYYFKNLALDSENNLYASIDYMLSSTLDISRPNIIKFDNKKWTIKNPVDKNGESLGYVSKINVDLSGKIWAALNTNNRGLAVFNGKKWLYIISDIPIGMFPEIAIDSANTVWLGAGDGVYLITQK